MSMNMIQLSNDEYDLIKQALVQANAYMKKYGNTPVSKQLAEAIQILKKSKGKTTMSTLTAVPSGGSSYYHNHYISKDDKIKDLLQSFALADRIGR